MFVVFNNDDGNLCQEAEPCSNDRRCYFTRESGNSYFFGSCSGDQKWQTLKRLIGGEASQCFRD